MPGGPGRPGPRPAGHEPLHAAAAAAIAALTQLAMQHGSDLRALLPPPGQIGAMGIEPARARAAGTYQLGRGRRAREATDRLAIEIKVARDDGDGEATRDERVDLGMPPCRAGHQPTGGRSVDVDRPGRWGRLGHDPTGAIEVPGQGCQAADGETFEGVGQVVHQMPAIGDLPRRRRTLGGAVGVHAVPIAAMSSTPGWPRNQLARASADGSSSRSMARPAATSTRIVP
jgi:hypothetical protein